MSKLKSKIAPFNPDFMNLFDCEPSHYAEAPGRVNLIGEHTDYNGGLVLPMAIPQRTYVEAAARHDKYVRVWTSELGGDLESYTLGAEVRTGDWLDYIKGVTYVLRKQGYAIAGFDLRVTSNVPLGSGLSSSASLEIAVLRVLRQIFSLALDDVNLAQLGQKVENDFVGANVGIMDQMAASLADEHTALRIDTRTLDYERVPIPPHCEVVVINSGVKHSHAGGEYNQRRRECEEAAKKLEVQYLTDILPKDLNRIRKLPEILQRRARHVITENARVDTAVLAMKAGDAVSLGQLFYTSHHSLREDYEVSIPEIDSLVEKARSHHEIWGARLTGGGFGGSVVMLAKRGSGMEAAQKIVQSYSSIYPHKASILLPLNDS